MFGGDHRRKCDISCQLLQGLSSRGRYSQEPSVNSMGRLAGMIKALVGDQINEEQALLTLMDTHDDSSG